MFAALLHLSLATMPAASFTATAPRAAHLLSQSAPPMPAPESTTREASLEADLAALNARIKATNVNWPTAAIIVSYAGGLTTYVSVLLALAGGLLGSTLLIPAIIAGLGGLGLLFTGVVVGMNAAAAAKSERDALIEERDALKRELDQSKARPGFVDGAFPTPPHSITVASF